jgi:8-oxo-dGTP diphosphatase
MIPDHKVILEEALIALRQKLDQRLNTSNLLLKTFTMKELQMLYEAVYEKDFPMNNFQKKILDLNVLERLEKSLREHKIKPHTSINLYPINSFYKFD